MSSRLLSTHIKIEAHKSMNIPAVVHGRETWSLTLKEERMETVFKNGVLRRIFGATKDSRERCTLFHNEVLRI